MKKVLLFILGSLVFCSLGYALDNFDKIGAGRQTVTTSGTEVQLSTSSIPCQRVIVTAEIDNTDTVVVGNVSVVASPDSAIVGTPLAAGDSYTMPINNVNKVYVDAQANGDGVTYTYYSN